MPPDALTHCSQAFNTPSDAAKVDESGPLQVQISPIFQVDPVAAVEPADDAPVVAPALFDPLDELQPDNATAAATAAMNSAARVLLLRLAFLIICMAPSPMFGIGKKCAVLVVTPCGLADDLRAEVGVAE
jgi:hypothetical protein